MNKVFLSILVVLFLVPFGYTQQFNPSRFPGGISTVGDPNHILYNYPAQDSVKVFEYFDDFIGYASGAIYNYKAIGTGVPALSGLAENGVLLISTSGTEGHSTLIQSIVPAIVRPASDCWFEAKFDLTDADQTRAVVGLIAAATTVPYTTTTNTGLQFWVEDEEPHIAFNSVSDTVTSVTPFATLTDGKSITVGFVKSASTLHLYKDRKLVRIISDYSFPATSRLLVTAGVTAGAGAIKTMSLDYIWYAVER